MERRLARYVIGDAVSRRSRTHYAILPGRYFGLKAFLRAHTTVPRPLRSHGLAEAIASPPPGSRVWNLPHPVTHRAGLHRSPDLSRRRRRSNGPSSAGVTGQLLTGP